MSEQQEDQKELTVNAKLIFEGEEVAAVSKTLSVRGHETDDADGEKSETRTIDDTLTEFFSEVQNIAEQSGYLITRKTLADATASFLLFIIKGTEQEATVDIELEKPAEEKENGNAEKDDT